MSLLQTIPESTKIIQSESDDFLTKYSNAFHFPRCSSALNTSTPKFFASPSVLSWQLSANKIIEKFISGNFYFELKISF